MTPKNTQTPITSGQGASSGRKPTEGVAGIDSQTFPRTFQCGATDHEPGELTDRPLACEGANANRYIARGDSTLHL